MHVAVGVELPGGEHECANGERHRDDSRAGFGGSWWILAVMASDDRAVEFISGNERLARILSDPDRRAQVDAITAEMDQIDGRYRDAVQALNEAVAATEATAGAPAVTEVLRALQRHLRTAGVRDLGITLTFSDHEVTVPLERIASADR
ncbi:hypothetical protein [Tsukamurella sp. 1534]|uniref:hypothetical protein n=1 Tax=Tsukamurella sp. 1534 TaxID=1151061 RepID=UPI0011D22F3E|nr:hypothetical protein [Tsukamurella sp. 1534]